MAEGASVYLEQRHELLRLGSSFMEVCISVSGGYGVASVENKLASNSLCRPPDSPTLFVISTVKDRVDKEFTNADAECCSHSIERKGRAVTLRMEFEKIGGLDLDVIASAAVTENEPDVVFRIKVCSNDADLTIRKVGYPWFSGYKGLGDDPAADWLVLPHREGILLDNPLGRVEGNRLGGEKFYYPGHASMQCMAVYDAKGGFLIWTDDTEGNVKRFACERRSDEDDFLTIGVEHYMPEVHGQDFCPEYSVRLTAFKGDWYDAADIYRKWATKQWWCRATLRERKDIPDWFRAPFPVFSLENYFTTGGTSPDHLRHLLSDFPTITDEYRKALGHPLINFWTGWERYGAWVSPDLFPPIEGEEALRKAIEAVRSKDDRVMIYFSQALWIRMGEEAERHFQEVGEPGGIMHRDGKRDQGETWFGKHTKMCPATELWQRTIRDRVLDCLARGIDVVQLDMFPILAPQACYDPKHPHPVGFGRWFHDATQQLITRARVAGKALQPDLVMSAEHMCELYIPLFDTFTSRDERRNLQTPWPRPEITDIPMFLYVYHEYLYTQALEWNMIYLDHFCRDVALQLARGKRLSFFEGYGSQDPNWKCPSEAELKANKKRGLAFLEKASRLMRTEAADFILTGKMLRPPQAFIVAADASRTPIDWNTTDPALGAFASADGKILIVLANAAESSRNVEIELTKGFCGSSRARLRNVLAADESDLSLPHDLSLSIQAQQITAFILGRRA